MAEHTDFKTRQTEEGREITGSLTIGRIPLVVCAPFFYRSDPMPDMTFVNGTLDELSQAIQAREIDCAPLSSIEYARNYRDYAIVPGLSIVGQSKVKTALFLSQVPWEQISGKNILLSSVAATSNILFQLLCRRKYQVDPVFNAPEEPMGRIAIGDDAIIMAYKSTWRYCYDLSEEWYKWQTLPFAFGLWIVRKTVADLKKGAVEEFVRYLERSQESFLQNHKKALKEWLKTYPSNLPEQLMSSFFEHVDYTLTPLHEKSLLLFFKMASDMGYANPCTSLDFVNIENQV
ncbi:menaquinone biosynthetic enzyme MqnA/MqnD family protein [Fibrobacterota bacterium]